MDAKKNPTRSFYFFGSRMIFWLTPKSVKKKRAISTGVAVGQLIVPGRASPSIKSKQSSKKLIAWWYLPLKSQRQLVDEHNHADTADDLDWNVKYGRGQRAEPCRRVGGVRADWCAGRESFVAKVL